MGELWCAMYSGCKLRFTLRARPVERYLEQTNVTKLSKMLISGELVNGSIVHIEAVPIDETVDEEFVDLGPNNKKLKTKLNYRISRGHSFTEDDLKKEIGGVHDV